MFTGIVEALGEVVEVEHLADSARLTIRSPEITTDAEPGASIAVNGVCLTVTGTAAGAFDADVMQETLKRSALTTLAPGERVNLERSVRLADRLGGHLVQGHVDATATVISRSPGDKWDVVRIALPPQLARYVVEKWSICVDGISLTVSAIAEDWF
jgi:riboflavin synthase